MSIPLLSYVTAERDGYVGESLENIHLSHWIGIGEVVTLRTPGGLTLADEPARGIAEFPELSAENDWPWWRGPTRNGVAAPGQSPPLHWSDSESNKNSENVLWSSLVPGRGHGSPTVVGDQVFIATADPQRETQSVLCFDRRRRQTAVADGRPSRCIGNQGKRKELSRIGDRGLRRRTCLRQLPACRSGLRDGTSP